MGGICAGTVLDCEVPRTKPFTREQQAAVRGKQRRYGHQTFRISGAVTSC